MKAVRSRHHVRLCITAWPDPSNCCGADIVTNAHLFQPFLRGIADPTDPKALATLRPRVLIGYPKYAAASVYSDSLLVSRLSYASYQSIGWRLGWVGTVPRLRSRRRCSSYHRRAWTWHCSR